MHTPPPPSVRRLLHHRPDDANNGAIKGLSSSSNSIRAASRTAALPSPHRLCDRIPRRGCVTIAQVVICGLPTRSCATIATHMECSAFCRSRAKRYNRTRKALSWTLTVHHQSQTSSRLVWQAVAPTRGSFVPPHSACYRTASAGPGGCADTLPRFAPSPLASTRTR